MLIQNRSPRQNLKTLGLAVVLFIILDVSVLAMNLWISWQVEQDAIAINLAGRQRMLSQRMTKAALLLGYSLEEERQREALDELKFSAGLFNQTLAAFADGGTATGGDNRPLQLPAVEDTKAKTLVAVAQERWVPLERDIQSLAWPVKNTQSISLAKALVHQNKGLLDLMNQLTSRIEAASLEQTKRLRLVQTVAFFLALGNFLVILRMLMVRYRQAAARTQQLHELIDQLGAGVLLLDNKGVIIDANEAARILFGQGQTYFPGQQLAALLREDGEYAFGYRNNGELWAAQVTYGEVVLDDVPTRIATVLDVTDRYHQARNLAYQAQHDPLTGLPNRRLFDDRIGVALAQAVRNRAELGVAVIDLDKFKPINDTYGHGVGDLILKAFADRLSGCVRASDTVARVGGDEFICLLQAINGEADLVTFAQRLLQALEQAVEAQGHFITMSASIGLARYPTNGSDAKALLAAADQAMYEAKTRGNTYAMAGQIP